MAKLYFRFGTVGSAKTLNLLAVVHNYRQQDKHVLLLKPKLDDRFGSLNVKSRAGLTMKADYLLTPTTIFFYNGKQLTNMASQDDDYITLNTKNKLSCLIVDEAQFLSNTIIDQLYLASIYADIPVILYGLKTNFKGLLFEGTKRILEIADSIEEIKTTCFFCNKKATHNLKLIAGYPTLSGPDIELGADETYKPSCKYCYHKKTNHLSHYL